MVSFEVNLQRGKMETISEFEAMFEQQEQGILSNISNFNQAKKNTIQALVTAIENELIETILGVMSRMSKEEL